MGNTCWNQKLNEESQMNMWQRYKNKDDRVTKAEAALLVKIFKFDMNLGKKSTPTFEDRFASENTNDMGELLLPQTSHIIISEFK